MTTHHVSSCRTCPAAVPALTKCEGWKHRVSLQGSQTSGKETVCERTGQGKREM